MPPSLSFPEPHHSNLSTYTLDTVNYNEHDDQTPLIAPTPSYGAANFPHTPNRPSSRKVILNATIKMACIFTVSSVFLGGILWLALPSLEEADRPRLRIPKSFVELKDLNGLLKKYRDIYPYRIVVCYVITYLFLQAFSLPGSMYLSILGGAVWGVARALPLVCCCVATGATLCYLISAALGPALLTLPRWKALLDKWAAKIQANKENMISFLIVLRIAPLPPHWVVNIICPHVGIGLVPFWVSTALGIFGVSVIHTTIGGGLDEMTSAEDFHLISWRNFLGLAAIVVGVLIPVGLRYWFRGQAQNALDDGEEQEEEEDGDILLGHAEEGDRILAVGPPRVGKKVNGMRVLVPQRETHGDEDSEFDEDEDDDEDVILEAGPAIPAKDSNNAIFNNNRSIQLPAAGSSRSSSR